MAYDETLAVRVRTAVTLSAERAGQEPREIAMFGGLCWTVNTHMAVGLIRDNLLVSVGKDGVDDAIARGAEQAMMGERPMVGMVRVPPSAWPTDDPLTSWVDDAVARALAKPPKPPKKPKKPKG